jgi:hypothetical protein
LDILVGGWQWSGMAKFNSGVPYSLNLNADIANIGNTGYERPNLVGSPKPSNQSPFTGWLNYSAFAVPTEYTYGNLGRDVFRDQFYKEFDMSLYKEVQFAERFHAKFTADAFNVFNEHIWGTPDTDLSDGDPATGGRFGIISGTASTARVLQLSGKFTF